MCVADEERERERESERRSDEEIIVVVFRSFFALFLINKSFAKLMGVREESEGVRWTLEAKERRANR